MSGGDDYSTNIINSGSINAKNRSSNRSEYSSINSRMKSNKSSSRCPMRVGGSTLHWNGRVVGKCCLRKNDDSQFKSGRTQG